MTRGRSTCRRSHCRRSGYGLRATGSEPQPVARSPEPVVEPCACGSGFTSSRSSPDTRWSSIAADRTREAGLSPATTARNSAAVRPSACHRIRNSGRVTAPRAGTSAPLTVAFGRSMNYPLLQRMLQVTGPKGRVAGAIATEERESVWRFTPQQPWVVRCVPAGGGHRSRRRCGQSDRSAVRHRRVRHGHRAPHHAHHRRPVRDPVIPGIRISGGPEVRIHSRRLARPPYRLSPERSEVSELSSVLASGTEPPGVR